MARLTRKRISTLGPGYAVTDADGVILPGRWANAEDAFEEGLLGVYLLSGMDVIKYDHCARCHRQITLDVDPETRAEFEDQVWSSVETLDSCTPGPNDEDRYHDPLHETPEEV